LESPDPQAEPQSTKAPRLNTLESEIVEEPTAESTVTFHPMDDPAHLDDSLLDDAYLKDSPLPKPLESHTHQEEMKSQSSKTDSPAGVDQPAPIPAVLLMEGGSLRVVCSGVGVMASDMLVRAEVQLRAGEMEVRGTQEGANHSGSANQLVARATLDALMQLVSDPILLNLTEIRTDRLGKESVVLCAVDLVEGRKSETLFGSCSNLHNEQQAVVFAVMDALNRRLSMYSLKSAEAEG
jgi:hypothetical protein